MHTIASLNFPEDISFGAAVAAFGPDRVLIGAPGYTLDPDFTDYAGAAYLYTTNGALLVTFSNPENQAYDEFGFSVVVFGNVRVLIGSRSLGPGAAYLFSTNGTLLTTFTNPTPASLDYFGHSIAAVGADRVLVGAYQDDTATTNAGAVYLFNTNGTLLLTITNPTPAVGDNFGNRLAMLGNDRVVIGAPGDGTTGSNAGSAYLFNINGTLLATLNNPMPASGDRFGYRLAAFGSEGAIIGALDDTGATDAGSAYLFSLPPEPIAPSLSIQLTSSNTVAVSWPSTSTGFVLQQNTNGVGSMNWSNVTASIQNDGMTKSINVGPSPGARFYRLFKPWNDRKALFMSEQNLVRNSILAGRLLLHLRALCFQMRGATNDDFSNAQTLTGSSGTTSGDNIGATKQPGEPDQADNSGGSSVWYNWTAPSDGSFFFSTFGSEIDTLLAVYTGNMVNHLTPVASNDDANFDLTSVVSFLATSGTTYRVAIDG